MSVPLAYISVILIWTTTPLAIRWGVDEAGVWEAASLRMALGAVTATVWLRLSGTRFPFDRRSRQVYLVSGLSIFGAMGLIYWASPKIPSGWIAVIFGLGPVATGFFSAPLLREKVGTRNRILGLLLALAGLMTLFAEATQLSAAAMVGVGAVFLGMIVHSGGSVGIKLLHAKVPAVAVTAGGLWVSTPLFLLAWAADGMHWSEPGPRGTATIAYLGVIGSVIGWSLFFYVLKHVEAVRVALITLITPVTALLLGYGLADEPLSGRILAGTGLVVAGLAAYEWPGLRRWMRRG